MKIVALIGFFSLFFFACQPIVIQPEDGTGKAVPLKSINDSALNGEKAKVKETVMAIVGASLALSLLVVIRRVMTNQNGLWAVVAWVVAVVISTIVFNVL